MKVNENNDLPCKMMFGTCSVSPYEPVVNTAPTKIPVNKKIHSLSKQFNERWK